MSKTLDSISPSDVSFRPAEPKDGNTVEAIANETKIDAWTSEQYQLEATKDSAVFIIAELGGEPIGFLCGRTVPAATSGIDGEIYNVALLPRVRRQNLGTQMLLFALNRFVRAGCYYVWLEVRRSNVGAILFYESRGFIALGERKGFYSNPHENAILMRLKLP